MGLYVWISLRYVFYIKSLEYSQLVDKDVNELQDDRILELETTTSMNGHILRNLTSVLADLTGKI